MREGDDERMINYEWPNVGVVVRYCRIFNHRHVTNTLIWVKLFCLQYILSNRFIAYKKKCSQNSCKHLGRRNPS